MDHLLRTRLKVPRQMGGVFPLSWLSVGWLAYLGVTGGFFTIIVRFLFPNVLFEPLRHLKLVTQKTSLRTLLI
ncbi:hypothetical protein Ct9H90mP12_0610 [bacterium]|nr:MAG: hypothetical protein Ct9H90mP12_0610 [bacterium]